MKRTRSPRTRSSTRATVGPSTGLLLISFGLGLSASAAGPVFNVTSFGDVTDAVANGVCETAPQNGACTLRAAVMEANHYYAQNEEAAEEVTIQLQLGTYTLTIPIGVPDDARNGDLNLTGKVRLAGKGAGILSGPATVIDASHIDRVLSVAAGATVTLQDLWIQGGRPPKTGGSRRYDGGGIYSDLASLTLLRCLVRDNATVAEGWGGGIYASKGTLAVRESNFRLNSAGSGGAILADDAATSVVQSTLSYNNASHGGGIHQSLGSLAVSNSTISDNYAALKGGGLVLSSVAAGATLHNVTVAINRADGPAPTGGGISLNDGSVTLSNSILFNTRTESELDDLDCSSNPTVISNGHNLLMTPGDCTVLGSYSSALPQVMNLASNGGPNATRALAAGSDAVNAGTPTGCEDAFGLPITTDQRGVKRPIGGACDLGAFELEPIGDANGDGLVNVSDVLYLVNHLFAGGPGPIGRANVNNDGLINVSDVLYLVNTLFAGGPAPVD